MNVGFSKGSDNLSLIENACQDIWVNFDVNKINQYYSSDFIGHEGDVTFNRDQIKDYVKHYSEKHTKTSCKIEDPVTNKNQIAVRMIYSTTAKGASQTVISRGIALFHFHNHKISAAWLAFEPALD